MNVFSLVSTLLCSGIFYTSCGSDDVVDTDSGTEEVAISAIGVDSIYYYEGDVLLYKVVNKYNERGHNTQEVYYQVIDGRLLKTSTNEYTYDANDNVLCESTINELKNTYWKQEYTYDAKGRMISWRNYNVATGQWGDVYQQEEYTYDSKSLRVLTTGKYFSQNPWEQDYRITYTHDGFGNEISEKKESWNGYDWYTNYANSFKYEYDSDNRVKSKTFQNEFSIKPDYRLTFSYDDAGNITSRIYAYPTSEGGWADRERHAFTFNSKNKLLTWINTFHDGISWKTSNKTTYTYDNDVYLKTEAYSYLTDTGLRSGRREYFYTILK